MTETSTGSGYGYGSFGSTNKLYLRKTSDNSPIDTTATHVRIVLGLFAATTPPIEYNSATGTWQTTGVLYRTNGATAASTSATAPNSNKQLTGNSSYPGLVGPESSLYFGGIAGKYKTFLCFPDGSFLVVAIGGVDHSFNLVAP